MALSSFLNVDRRQGKLEKVARTEIFLQKLADRNINIITGIIRESTARCLNESVGIQPKPSVALLSELLFQCYLKNIIA